MAGRFFTAAVLFAAAFASDNSTSSNSTASTFTYDAPADEVANTPATDDYGTSLPFLLLIAPSCIRREQHDHEVDSDY